MVLSGLVIAWRFATWPTSRSPLLARATTEGGIRPPSALGMTTGSAPPLHPSHAGVRSPQVDPDYLSHGQYPSSLVFVRPSFELWLRIALALARNVRNERGAPPNLLVEGLRPSALPVFAPRYCSLFPVPCSACPSPLPTTTIAGRRTRPPSL